MFKLVKKGFEEKNIISFSNMFLIGNGHLGYKGTLEEFSKEQMTTLNIVGIYDRYQKKWRESINMPNPFFAVVYSEEKSFSILKNKDCKHEINLDIKHAIFKRKTIYEEVKITSERFISQTINNLLCEKYQITSHKNQKLFIDIGLDSDVYDINGPHFSLKEINRDNNVISFKGKTNERKVLKQKTKYIIDKNFKELSYENGIMKLYVDAKENKTYTFYIISKIEEDGRKKNIFIDYKIKDYNIIKKQHNNAFIKMWETSDVIVKGNKKAQFAVRYSIYHLLILANNKYTTSIPARGVSGQTYKGAIFWDTEIFLLPFYTLTNPTFAKNLLIYRIKTLKGAINKAKMCGYKGAFYAWESQEKGQEGCSKYNVTDVFTNKPVRTYFGEKQIHISADIAYGLFNYCKITNDFSLLENGGLEMLKQICDFYISYATYINGKYHILDVIGPDEYHERIDDNAFTNYMIYYVVSEFVKYAKKYNYIDNFTVYNDFAANIYLPEISKDYLIEQFSNYYLKEDVLVDDVRKRLRHKSEYWGTKNGVAFNTRVIKQADVITLLVLLNNLFNDEVNKANFDFYYKYTEHGSSLSSSMYSIIASRIDKLDIAYKMFYKSASIDLGVDQKMFAGTIYIGGTHPASNAGAYLSLLFGFAGLRFIDDKIVLCPKLPKQIKGLKFKIFFKNKKYLIDINKDNSYKKEEIL